jgi:hypothetical protein
MKRLGFKVLFPYPIGKPEFFDSRPIRDLNHARRLSKTGESVLFSAQTCSHELREEQEVIYIFNRWVYPRSIEEGSLTVFTNLRDAVCFASRHHYRLYRCEYLTSNEKMHDRKGKCTVDTFPKGTDFACAVKILPGEVRTPMLPRVTIAGERRMISKC